MNLWLWYGLWGALHELVHLGVAFLFTTQNHHAAVDDTTVVETVLRAVLGRFCILPLQQDDVALFHNSVSVIHRQS